MNTGYFKADRAWKLPPLILHPFSDVTSPQKLVQSSRASLMLQGLLPNDAYTTEQLEEILDDGRYCEIRMLFYIGKDLVRWIEQAVGMMHREPSLHASGIEWQSFSSLIVEDAPPLVKEKLQNWGVADYRTIFSRAIGFNAIFAELPGKTTLSTEFIRSYHQYADHMYEVKQSESAFTPLRSKDFDFELFASGEYSRILERQWQDPE